MFHFHMADQVKAALRFEFYYIEGRIEKVEKMRNPNCNKVWIPFSVLKRDLYYPKDKESRRKLSLFCIIRKKRRAMSFNSHSSTIVDLLYHCIRNRIGTTTEVYILFCNQLS